MGPRCRLSDCTTRVYELSTRAHESELQSEPEPASETVSEPPEPATESETESPESVPTSEPVPETPESASEPVPGPVDTQSRTKASVHHRDRLSVCMMTSDDMNDFLLTMSPETTSVHMSPVEQTPLFANLLESTSTTQLHVEETSPTSVTHDTVDSYIVRIRDKVELVAQTD